MPVLAKMANFVVAKIVFIVFLNIVGQNNTLKGNGFFKVLDNYNSC